jgi:uncharacterized protein
MALRRSSLIDNSMARNNRMHMTVSESDLNYLDKWLSSDGSPPNSMMLSDLDGFLTAVAIGPDLIMPSEWLPVVWGGRAPEFKSQRQAQRIMETILGRYNEILHTLDTDPDALEPIFWSKDDGTVIVEDWAMGFLDGIQLRLKHWVPLLKPGKQGVLIVPIAMYWFDKDGENVHEPNVETIDKVLDDAPDLIRQAVIDIHAYWRARGGQATTH